MKYTFLLFLAFFIVDKSNGQGLNCNTATPITIPASGVICVNGTIVGDSTNGFYSPCEIPGSYHVWYTFISTGSADTITVSPRAGTPASNLVVSITSTGCNSIALNTCGAAPTANGTATATWIYPPGTQVWVFISSASNSGGNFQLCVSSISTPPSTGKDCSTAVPLCNLNPFTATVATGSNGFQPPCFTNALQQPIIFKFTVAQTGLLNWKATPVCGAPNAASTEFDWALYDITAGCAATTEVACDYNYAGSTTPQGMQGAAGAGCNNSTVTFNNALEICNGVTVTAGNTYAIYIDQFTAGSTCAIDFNFNGSTFLIAPLDSFTASPTVFCQAGTVTLTNYSLAVTSQTWSFGDGTTSTAANPGSHTYNSPGTYLISLTTTSATGCTNVKTKSIQVFAAPIVSAGNDTAVCANQGVVLNGSAQPSTGTYTYLWSPANGLSNANILNPIATPMSTTQYTLSVTDANGCTASDIMNLTISGVAVPVNASVTPTVVCPGQQVQLNADVLPTICGVTSPCAANTLSSVVGGGNTPQPGTGYSATTPTILGNLVQSGRNQMLYTAAELTAALGGPCTVKTISINVAIFNNTVTLNNFMISVACTNLTNLATYDNNLTTVYTNTPGISPTAGWNNFNLNNAFNWDGVSNLIVDVCWYDPGTFGNQNEKAQCTTTLFNSYLWLNGATDLCGTSNPPNISTLRPNLRFNYCVPDINTYTINWVPNTGSNAVSNAAIANPTANPIVNTNYTITVGNGACPTSQTVSVQVDNSTVNAGPDINACPTTSTPLIATAVGTLIPGPPVYSWTTLAGTAVTSPVSPAVTTTYVVKMTGGACPKYDTMTIFVGSLTVTPTPTNATCFGANDGKINVTANGTPTYTYLWSANANSGNVNPAVGLAPGSYQVSVTDVNGCSGSATASITQPTQVTISPAHTNATCFGGSNGTITLTPAGGVGPYTYLWSNGLPPNNPATGLQANTYTVTVKDASLCSATSSITVAQPTAITFGNPVIVNVRCFNGTTGKITVSPTGGTPPYTYSWSQNAGLNSPVAQNLAAGSYTVTVKDLNNCTVSATNVVSQPASGITLPTPTFTGPSCFGGNNGTATANPAGGALPYVYLWSPSNQITQTATGLSAQSYSVTVTDDSICTATASVTINQPPQMSVSGIVTNVLCNGGSTGAITTTITNGVAPLSFAWSNGAGTQNITGLVNNNYSITVTDNSGCTATNSFIVTQPQALVLNAPAIIPVSCFGGNNGSVTVNPAGGTGGYGYTWNPAGGGVTKSALTAGNYSVTVTDANNCTASASYQVTQPASALVFGAPVVVNISCNGGTTGSITVSISGGTPTYTYSWSQNNQLNNPVASSLGAGNYIVTVTDANSCTISASNAVAEPTAITFGAPVIADVSCYGYSNGSASVTPTGGTGAFTFTWNGNAGTNPETNLAANTYNVVVTDASNCTAATTVIIAQPALFGDSAIITLNNKCFQSNDGSITVIPTGGNPPFSYQWSNNQTTQTANQLAAGAYSCTVTDNTGCSFSVSGAVTQPPLLVFLSKVSTAVKCVGDKNGTITVAGAGGVAPYDYSVTQDGSNFYYPTNGAIQGLDTGLYTIVLSDSNGCTIEDTIRVNNAIPDTYTVTTDSTSCYGAQYTDGAIHVNGLTANNMPYQYSVDGGLFQFSPDFFNQPAGIHHITGQNNFGCLTNLTAIVPSPLNGVASVMPKDTTLQLGASIQLSTTFGPFASSAIVSYNWTPSIGLSCIDCPNPVVGPYSRETQYVVTITYNGHCMAADSMVVIILNNLHVFIPNSFSPNGDGNNDIFQIYGEGIKEIELRIFNRWGEMVYESNNQFSGWDGTYKGQLQNPAVFVYDVQIIYLDDKKVHRTGSVTLIR